SPTSPRRQPQSGPETHASGLVEVRVTDYITRPRTGRLLEKATGRGQRRFSEFLGVAPLGRMRRSLMNFLRVGGAVLVLSAVLAARDDLRLAEAAKIGDVSAVR